MPRQEYNVLGTADNVNKAIEECGKTNREEVSAEKEVKLMEWEVNLKKSEMETAATMARIEKENEERMKKLDCDLEVNLKKIECELTADHKFELQSKEIDAKKELWLGKMGMDHKERMEVLKISHEQTMGAMNIKGNFALTALQKSGQKSFKMKNTALTFQTSNNQKMMKKFKPHNMLEMDRGLDAIQNESEIPSPLLEEEDETVTDENIFNEFEMEFDTNVEKELEMKETNFQLEMEKMKMEQSKLKVEAQKMALMQKMNNA